MVVLTLPTLSTELCPDGTEIVTLDGEFELAHMPSVGHRLTDVLAQCERDLVLDLRGVSFLDSKMLRMLLIALRQAGSRGCRLVLVRPNDHVWRVFQVAGFDSLFPSFHDLREAVGGMSAPHP